MDQVEHSKTFLYAILDKGYTTHGHKTSNIAEILNNVIAGTRHGDPYHFGDFLVRWFGEKLSESQSVAKTLAETNKLLTPYAQELLGKREIMAREARLTIQTQGNENYLVIHDFNEIGYTSTVSKRYNVNLQEKTCSCPFVAKHRLPCEHIVAVLDSLHRRDTPEKYEAFKQEWIAPYFWSERYISAYQCETVGTPDLDTSKQLQLPRGVRVVTKPLMPKKEQEEKSNEKKIKRTRRKTFQGQV